MVDPINVARILMLILSRSVRRLHASSLRVRDNQKDRTKGKILREK